MALIADFMLVWLPAPTLSYAAKKAGRQGKLGSFLASCPDNAFQVLTAQRGMFPLQTVLTSVYHAMVSVQTCCLHEWQLHTRLRDPCSRVPGVWSDRQS